MSPVQRQIRSPQALDSPDIAHPVFEENGAIRIEPVEFPGTDSHVDRDCFSFCRRLRCLCRSEKQGLSATVHQDCFNLYMRWTHFAEPERRLWKISMSRSPWRPGCDSTLMEPEPDLKRAGYLLTGILELMRLPHLPLEIVMLIAKHLGTSGTMLRFAGVQETVEVAARLDLEDAALIPLRQIASWHRGGRPVMRNDDSDSVVEVTIDARGIKSIERLPDFRRGPRSPWKTYNQIRSGDAQLDLLVGIPPSLEEFCALRLTIGDSPRPHVS